jgi:3-hydroxyacyl-CoA dehydrogenase
MGIQKVAVLGAGVMGQGIAAHLANAGIPSLLFDIAPKPGADGTIADRRAIAKGGVANLAKLKPAPLYRATDSALISPCEYEADADRLKEADLIIEAVAEVLKIKNSVYDWVEKNRKAGSIIASNTSGIPLSVLSNGRSADFKNHFMITHFFNPVRYMRLLELVGGPDTSKEVLHRAASFGEAVLGKGVVWAKDTPAFVANRIGTYGICSVFKHMADEKGQVLFSVEQVDTIWGKPMGRPASAVFRTGDLVGLDTLAHVIKGLYDSCPDDPGREYFKLPPYVSAMLEKGTLGEKSGAGFYKKVKKEDGSSEILALDLNTLEYRSQAKVRYASLGAARGAESSAEAVKIVLAGSDEAAQFAWKVTADTLLYAASLVGQIADDVVNIDRAMRWGFAWEMGPFESWDALGVPETVARMESEGRQVPAWIKEMLQSGRTSFYSRVNGDNTFWAPESRPAPGLIRVVPDSKEHLMLADIKAKGGEVDSNVSASLLDLGDGVLCLEFHTKMNALDDLVFAMYEKALDELDAGRYDALVVGNQGHAGSSNAFCAGANLLMILMGAMQEEWQQLEGAVKRMQDLLMRAKYHSRPVVTAPWGLTLGGGVEVTMHSAATVGAGELYAGLVEVGVGLIPAGGGCKELLARFLGDLHPGVAYDSNPFVQKVFEYVGTAKIAVSGEEARDQGFLRVSDRLTVDPDRLIYDARQLALGLSEGGYKPGRKRSFKLPGASGRAAIELYLYQMQMGGFISEHDALIGKKLAFVLTGGDCAPGSVKTEQDILDLEREAFLSLLGTEKTKARIQFMLEKGKPLRN